MKGWDDNGDGSKGLDSGLWFGGHMGIKTIVAGEDREVFTVLLLRPAESEPCCELSQLVTAGSKQGDKNWAVGRERLTSTVKRSHVWMGFVVCTTGCLPVSLHSQFLRLWVLYPELTLPLAGLQVQRHRRNGIPSQPNYNYNYISQSVWCSFDFSCFRFL